jgi:hypothetical protein
MDYKTTTFKGLAHLASYLKTASQLAGLGGQVVVGELVVNKPTVGLVSRHIGTSATGIYKAAKCSTLERELLVSGKLTLADLGRPLDEPQLSVPDGTVTIIDKAITAEPTPVVEEKLSAEERLLFGSPTGMTVDDLLAVYVMMPPSEQIAFGRAIGIDRVWQPRQRLRRNGNNGVGPADGY